jgi:AcrR family transcriptional regulator
MLHHFPERAALLVAAVEYVFEQRLRDFQRSLTRLVLARSRRETPPQAQIEDAVDVLWAVGAESNASVAWLELLVAARTDPVLRTALTRMMRAFDTQIEAVFDAWFPVSALASPESAADGRSVAQRFTFALMNGLMLDRIAGYEHAPAVLDVLKTLARRLVRVDWQLDRLAP